MRYQIFSSGKCEILNICSIGYGESPEITHFGPGKRNLYIIHFVISGRGYFNTKSVAAGQGFIIYPKALEHYYPELSAPWSFLWAISDDIRIKHYFEKYNADSNGIFEYNISSVRSAKELVVKNHNKILNPDEMLELFLHIFNNRLYLKNSMPKNADIYLDYAEHYIKINIFSNVRINDLTKQLGITQPYLYKLFMNRYGISTAAYIRKCKLDEAKRLLIETNLTITQIANSVGYDSVMDFSKFFKKQTGRSPSDFRKTG